MKVAVIGSGGREHAIIRKLSESPLCSEIIAVPGNAGISNIAQCFAFAPTDVQGIVELCKTQKIDYVVVTPDDPLAVGMVDALEAAGIEAFGPNKAAARIESSKVFAKNLMSKYNIPTASYEAFNSAKQAMEYLERYEDYPVVIKADGLALGKGVLICDDLQQAQHAVQTIMVDGKFGASGNSVVIEQFLTGPEVSVLALTDGNVIVPMASSMDHKRALDGDKGLNTGGMGAIAPNPFYTPEVAATCMQKIFLPTLEAMRVEGCPFKGCLYFGLMLTQNGPYVIEYNCRFGDPEAQVAVPLMQGDLLSAMIACTRGTLEASMLGIQAGAAACVVLASGGYPEKYVTGREIFGIKEAQSIPDVAVYHAGTKYTDGKLVTAGGRVLGVTAYSLSLEGALDNAYRACSEIHFEDMQYRRDIGRSALSVQN